MSTELHNPYEQIESGARNYIDVRPNYPEEIIDLLQITSETVVCDIGAGTGKLTQQLWQRTKHVHAVEPAPTIRAGFQATLPEFPLSRLHHTTAENTQLPPAHFDLLTYGQCWHWLDWQAASIHAAQLLRENGKIAIIYNQFNVQIDWVLQLSRIMRSGDVQRFDKPPKVTSAFTPPVLYSTQWTQHLTVTEMFTLGTTRSSWIKSTPENRLKMRENLRWYLQDELGYNDTDTIALPYHTYLWLAELA